MTIIDGVIDLGDNLLVTRALREDDFLTSKIALSSTIFVESEAHRSYKLPISKIEDKYFLPVLYFSGGILAEAHLYSVSKDDAKKRFYSAAKEVEKKRDNDSWLARITGLPPPYSFSWGHVESVWDEKSGASFILLRYSTG